MKLILATSAFLAVAIIFFAPLGSQAKSRIVLKNGDKEPAAQNLFRTSRELRSLAINPNDEDYDTFNSRATAMHAKHLESAVPVANGHEKPFELELPEGYDKFSIPKDKLGNPIKVYIQLNIQKILDFNELEEQIKLDVEFRVFWTDFKIRDMYNEQRAHKRQTSQTVESLTPEEVRRKMKTLNNPKVLDTVWKPNLFFESLLEVKQPAVMTQPITLRLIPEVGWFEYLTRVIVLTDCPMGFRYYPADTQDCKFGIRGFSYTKKDLQLEWYKTGVWLHELSLSSFDVQVDNLREYFLIEDDEDPNSDHFDVLAFNIKARRRLSYHLVQTYIASTFYIVITCLCFLLPARFVEARIGISMTTLLTLTAMFGAVRESTPIVSYVKAIDTWMVGCIIFVFLTLAEFTFHTWLRGMMEDHEEQFKKKSDKMIPFTKRTKENPSAHEQEEPMVEEPHVEMIEIRSRKGSSTPAISKSAEIKFHLEKMAAYSNWMRIMEKYSFTFFIVLIAVYTFLYWSWLLTAADYFDWSVDPTNNNLNGTRDDD